MSNSDRAHAHGQQSQHGGGATGVLERAQDMGVPGAGRARRVWETAEEGTQDVASALPDAWGLGSVKDFVGRHPVLSTCIVLAVAWYFLGGSLPVVGDLFGRDNG